MKYHLPRFPWYQWVMILCSLAIILLLLNGCTQEDVDRAQVAADQAQAYLARVEVAEKKATEAVAIADNLATELGSEKAKAAVEKAKATMQVIEDAHAVAEIAVHTTQATLTTAKASMAAGEGTFDMLLDILKGFVPGAGVAVLAIKSAIKSGKALKQTVKGVEGIRNSMGEADWKAKAMPALHAAQDESVKLHIRKIQASV